MTFDRTRELILPVEPEESFTYTFNNVVTESGNRQERRIARRTQFRATINYGDIIFKCGEDADFITFYQESNGTVDSFLVKSNVDFTTTEAPDVKQFDNSYFTYTQGVAYWEGATFMDGRQWSIYKKYAIASGDPNNPTDAIASYKRIYEIDNATFQLFDDGVEVANIPTNFVFDPVTSLLNILATSVNPSDVVTFNTEYYHRMRFGDLGADKELTLTKISSDGVYRLSNLSLVEVILSEKPNLNIFSIDDFAETTEAQLEMPLESANSRVLSLPVLAKSLDSGRESRIPNSSGLFIDETLSPTSLYQNESDYLRDFFVACKGRITGFRYEVDQGLRFSRFNQDAITVTKKTAVDVDNSACTVYDIGEILMSQIDVQVVEIVGQDTDLYGVTGGVFTSSDRFQCQALFCDIAYYVSKTSHAAPGATGKVYPELSTGLSTTRFLTTFTAQRGQTQSNGKNIVVMTWISRSTSYYTDDTLTGHPTSAWDFDLAALRAALLPGDKYIAYGVLPTSQETNPGFLGLDTLFDAVTNGTFPYDVPGQPQYAKDLIDNGTLKLVNFANFDRGNTDINPYLPDVFGGSITVDYSGIDNTLQVYRTRSNSGLTTPDVNDTNNFQENIDPLLELNVFNQVGATGQVRVVSFAGDGRWLRAFNNAEAAGANTAMVFSAGSDTVNYYTDDTATGQPTATWISDATTFNGSVEPTTDYIFVGQKVPAGSEADPDYVGFLNQLNFATGGVAPYNVPSNPEYIADNSENITGQVIDASLSALPVVEHLGGVVSFDVPTSGDNPILVAAFCLKMDTAEGTIGFTSFDSDLIIGGVLYQANFNIDAYAGKSEVNLSADNGAIEQVFDGFSAWTPEQIAAGYLSGNRIELRLFNVFDLPATFAEGIPVISGNTGNVTLIDGSFKFEVRSSSELLNRPITHKTAPKCIYEFGDGRCGLDLVALGYQFDLATVTAVSGDFGETMTVDVLLNDRFPNGTAEVLSGTNVGLKLTIDSVTGTDTLTVAGEFAGNFQIGDTLKLVAFCAKDQTACQFYSNFERFGNIPVGGNFVPGLTRIAVAPT